MQVKAVVLTKSAFAALINVTPGRVSQMLAAGMIGRDALVGTGRNEKIIVDVAKRQIAARRDVYQALGNGLSTRLDVDTSPAPLDADLPAEIVITAYAYLVTVTLCQTYGIEFDEAHQVVKASWEKASEIAFALENNPGSDLVLTDPRLATH